MSVSICYFKKIILYMNGCMEEFFVKIFSQGLIDSQGPWIWSKVQLLHTMHSIEHLLHIASPDIEPWTWMRNFHAATEIRSRACTAALKWHILKKNLPCTSGGGNDICLQRTLSSNIHRRQTKAVLRVRQQRFGNQKLN